MPRTLTVFGMILIAALCLAAGCGKRVQRISPGQATDLSGRWNDTDSGAVSKEIIKDCLAQSWLTEWKLENDNGRPVVIVGNIVNKSHEHINVQTFVKDIQRALINSQKVRFVSSRSERDELREERSDQHEGHTSGETRAGVGRETGANFMMKGSINTILDELEEYKAIYYQVNVELHNLTTNEISWVGQKEIKKIIDRDSTKW